MLRVDPLENKLEFPLKGPVLSSISLETGRILFNFIRWM